MSLDVNYYDLAGIDPRLDASVPADNQAIKAVLDKRKREWGDKKSASNEDTRVLLGLSFLKRMVLDLAHDPVRWGLHRDEYKKFVANRDARDASRLRDALAVMDGARIKKATIAEIANSLQITADEMERAASASGAEIWDSELLPNEKKLKPIYNTYKAITKLLGGSVDLDIYSFLSQVSEKVITPQTDSTTIRKTLEDQKKAIAYGKLSNEILNKVRTLLNESAKADRARFDEFMRFHSLRDLEELCERLAKDQGFISAQQLERLISIAVDRSGFAKSDVEAHFRKVLSVIGAKVEVASAKSVPESLVCGYCGGLSFNSGDTCTHCRHPLLEKCINCGAKRSTTIKKCPSCGITDNESVNARASAAAGTRLIREGDIAQATLYLKELMSVAPSSEAAADLRREIGARDAELAETLRRVNTLMSAGAMREAQRTVLASKLISPKLAAKRDSIDDALVSAEQLLRLAKVAESKGDRKEAIRHAIDAQARVSDDSRPEQFLLSIPPDPPRNLRLMVRDDGAVDLRWIGSAAVANIGRVVYRVLRGLGTQPDTSRDTSRDSYEVAKSSANGVVDRSCPSGVDAYYAVIACKLDDNGSMVSSSQPVHAMKSVLVLRPVRDLSVQQNESAFLLQWSLPESSSHAEIVRCITTKGAAQHGDPVVVAKGEEQWLDGHAPKSRVEYAVEAVYVTASGAELRSEPVRVRAQIAPLPSTVELQPGDSSDRVLRWAPEAKPSERDEVYVYDSPPDGLGYPKVVSKASLPAPINRHAATGSKHTTWKCGALWYVIVRSRGELARCSEPRRLVSYDRVKALSAKADGLNVHLEWEWPEGCASARVEHRMLMRVSHPSGQRSMQTGSQVVTRESDSPRASHTLKIGNSGNYTVNVFAREAGGTTESLAAESSVALTAPNELLYQYEYKRTRGFGSPKPIINIWLKDPEPLPKLIVRFGVSGPLSDGEGEVLCVHEGSDTHDRCSINIKNELAKRIGFIHVELAHTADALRIKSIPLGNRVTY